jgi:hypothetical protein
MSDPCSIAKGRNYFLLVGRTYKLTGFVAWADQLQMHGHWFFPALSKAFPVSLITA